MRDPEVTLWGRSEGEPRVSWQVGLICTFKKSGGGRPKVCVRPEWQVEWKVHVGK